MGRVLLPLEAVHVVCDSFSRQKSRNACVPIDSKTTDTTCNWENAACIFRSTILAIFLAASQMAILLDER